MTGGAGYVLTRFVGGKSLLHTRTMDAFFATVHQKQFLPIFHLVTVTDDTPYPVLHRVRTSRRLFSEKRRQIPFFQLSPFNAIYNLLQAGRMYPLLG